MPNQTLSTSAVQRFYDSIGGRYDWFESFESQAKLRAIQCLALEPGQWVLNVGVGTGKEHSRLQAAVAPHGKAFGLDLSRVMLDLTRERTHAPLCQADARWLPFARGSFDRLYAAYVLDLLPSGAYPELLSDFYHLLKPGGRAVLLALTEGVDLPSRALVAAWKMIYAISPLVCGGCRPLQLTEMVKRVGFDSVGREVIVQLGLPSEIVVACR